MVYEYTIKYSGTKKIKINAPTADRGEEILRERIDREEYDLTDEGVDDYEVTECEIVD